MASSDYQMALLLQRQLEHESSFRSDLSLAQKLQEDFNNELSTENPVGLVYENKEKKKDDTRSLVDPSWELIDPTPNIYNLFVAFDQRFFWNKLLAVCVSWSKRMTSCAGICSYQGRGGMCSITLSEPLLKLRPRKDLVETLLHEMIHAYLFVTHNNKDRDGHGPEFHKHMYRINNEAGTKITVYHTFHDEVRLYQQYWWRCNGPCQNRKPYFGMVRRATNRAPGPNDRWWDEHTRTCGGIFTQVKEPEKKSTSKGIAKVLNKASSGDIRNFITVTNKNNSGNLDSPQKTPKISPVTTTGNIHGITNLSIPQNNVIKQISNGNITKKNNNVIGATKTKSNSNSTIVINKKSNTANDESTSAQITKSTTVDVTAFSGTGKTLGSPGTSPSKQNKNDYSVVRSHWANKFPPISSQVNKRNIPQSSPASPKKKQKMDEKDDQITVTDIINLDDSLVACPVCEKQIKQSSLNDHLDLCLLEQDKKERQMQQCFVCNKEIPQSVYREHINNCFENNVNDDEEMEECEICNTWFSESKIKAHREACIENILEGSSPVEILPGTCRTKESNSSVKSQCSICNHFIDINELNTHKGRCLLKVFDDLDSKHGLNKKVEAGQEVSCLVCNKKVLKSELNAHLDECMSGVFDKSNDFDAPPTSTSVSNKNQSHDCDNKNGVNDKYNCPFCMELYSELDMSAHLDDCLVDDNNTVNKAILIDSFTSDEIL